MGHAREWSDRLTRRRAKDWALRELPRTLAMFAAVGRQRAGGRQGPLALGSETNSETEAERRRGESATVPF
jgi:hypothetical protein